jgi:glyoxylase-like metal-dependent hydrolase (beta-lactamase superfamily II)
MIDVSTRGGGIDEQKFREMQTDGIEIDQMTGILITHIHMDHARGIPFWVKKIGKDVPIFIHPSGVKYIHDQQLYIQDLNASIKDYHGYITSLPEGLTETMTNWIWGAPSRYDNVQEIMDGEILDCGDTQIRVIWTPGHSIDHCAFEVTSTIDENPKRYLISGDMISFQDMQDAKGLTPLASFNTPLSLYRAEIESLQKIANNPPDVLLTGHYGRFESREKIQQYFQNAIEEGTLLWDRTIEILRSDGPQTFPVLTRKIINFKKYLSGISTRTSSMFVILREMKEAGIIEESENKPPTYRILEK